jgi:hypothetical protein
MLLVTIEIKPIATNAGVQSSGFDAIASIGNAKLP